MTMIMMLFRAMVSVNNILTWFSHLNLFAWLFFLLVRNHSTRILTFFFVIDSNSKIPNSLKLSHQHWSYKLIPLEGFLHWNVVICSLITIAMVLHATFFTSCAWIFNQSQSRGIRIFSECEWVYVRSRLPLENYGFSDWI